MDEPPVASKGTSKLAIASLVCGLLICLPLVGGVAALILGLIALSAFSKPENQGLGGKGMAIAGIVLGGVSLLLLPVYIGIIAAFAIPSMLESKTSANESGAQRSLRCIADAEELFSKTDPDQDGKDYCCDLANLHDQPDAKGNPIALIDPLLKTGTNGNYLFGALPTYSAVGSAFGKKDKLGFAYYAVPEVYGQTGRKTYILNSEGLLFSMDTGGKIPTGWPTDPFSEGWVDH